MKFVNLADRLWYYLPIPDSSENMGVAATLLTDEK